MKEYLKGVLAEGKPGLYICEILTGYGKTYNSVQAIVEYIREQHPNKKIFFLTTLKKNLPDDDFKRAFADDDPSKKEVLRIQSNLDEVCDGIHTVDVPERFQSTAYKALLHAVDRYLTVKNKVYDAEYVESLRKQANEAESAFRFELGYQLRAVESDPDRLLSLIESHKDFKWVGLLYPAVFTKKASVIQMSVNKFLTRNATIIEPSYAFLSSEMIKDSVIIIDEFDATKSTIKEVIIEKSLRLCDEYLNLFRQIVSFFDTDNNTFISFPSLLVTTCTDAEKQLNKVYHRSSLVAEAKKIQDKYFVTDLNYKTVESSVDRKQKFLLKDATFHSLLGNNARYIRAVKNEATNKADIYFETPDDYQKNKKDNDIHIYSLLRAIDRFFFHFQKLLLAWASEYANTINESRGSDSKKMTDEEALHSILSQFRLTRSQRDMINGEFMASSSAILREDGILPDGRFYIRGMKIFEFADSDAHNEQTDINLIEVFDTPEKILLSLAQRATVIGLSATAAFQTAIGNYDLEFLSEKLGPNLHFLPIEVLQRIKNEMEEIWLPYRQGHINVHSKIAYDFYNWEGSERCCSEFFTNREYADIAGSLISSKTESEYYQKNYCQVLRAMHNFVANERINSMLYLGMQLAKQNSPNFDTNLLSRLFELSCNDVGVEKGKGIDIIFLGGAEYDTVKVKLLECLASGQKIFIISSYATLGAGQNLQYEVSDKQGLIELVPEKGVGDKRHSTKDIDAIFLGDITHLAVNTYSDRNISKEELMEMLFQIQELKESSEISFQDAESLIKLAFESHIAPHPGHYNKLFHVRSLRVMATRTVLQAIGRICRTHLKNPDIYIYVHSGLLGKIEVDELKKRILPPEMESLITLRESYGSAYSKDDQKLARVAERISSYSYWDIQKFLEDDWTVLSMSSYNALRPLSLRFPTASEDNYLEHPDMKRHYITSGENQNTYLYSQHSNYSHVSIFWRDNEVAFRESGIAHKEWGTEEFHIFKMCEQNTHLQAALLYPGMYEYFVENQYATEFKAQKYMMCPVMYNNIYKGALGEVCGSFILKKERNIDLRPIEDPDKFEFFDYILAPDVYIDFKNWKFNFNVDRKEVLHHISDKLDKIGGKRAYIVNLVGSDRFRGEETVDERIIQIPGLIDSNGRIIPSSMKMFKEEDLCGFNKQSRP